jgi:hypothetical protein
MSIALRYKIITHSLTGKRKNTRATVPIVLNRDASNTVPNPLHRVDPIGNSLTTRERAPNVVLI